MTLMALDHANLFIARKHSNLEIWGGPFPAYDAPLPFLVRFVTHLAAPGFFLLMGVGMVFFVSSRRKGGWGKWQIGRHFVLRGALLIAIQLLIINRAWELSPDGWGIRIYFGVLYALGAAMLLGSLLVWLRWEYLAAIALILFVGTEFLVPDISLWGGDKTLDNLLLVYAGGNFRLGVWSNYPVFPWLELMVFGMMLGKLVQKNQTSTFNLMLWGGLVLLGAFLIVRAIDGFGNIRPRAGNTWIDWLNVVKYPPSMAFTLLTTGINLLLLYMFSKVTDSGQKILKPLVIFGRAPLCFYILHLFLYAGLGRLIASQHGTSILLMLPVWLLGLLMLLPVCYLYGGYRQKQPANALVHYL